MCACLVQLLAEPFKLQGILEVDGGFIVLKKVKEDKFPPKICYDQITHAIQPQKLDFGIT